MPLTFKYSLYNWQFTVYRNFHANHCWTPIDLNILHLGNNHFHILHSVTHRAPHSCIHRQHVPLCGTRLHTRISTSTLRFLWLKLNSYAPWTKSIPHPLDNKPVHMWSTFALQENQSCITKNPQFSKVVQIPISIELYLPHSLTGVSCINTRNKVYTIRLLTTDVWQTS